MFCFQNIVCEILGRSNIYRRFNEFWWELFFLLFNKHIIGGFVNKKELIKKEKEAFKEIMIEKQEDRALQY